MDFAAHVFCVPLVDSLKLKMNEKEITFKLGD